MKIYVWNTREYFTCQFHRKSVYYNITCISLSAIQVSKGLILIVDILANTLYYSFKIFPQFWMAKSTRIIHQNQLLMIKFGRILCLMWKWRQKCSLLQVNAPLTEKNIAKTARRQLGGRHLLFWKIFAELDKPRRKLSKINLTSMQVSLF